MATNFLRRKKPRGYIITDRRAAEDKRISYKARGILTFMLGKPDGWQFYVENIADNSDKDGLTAVRSGLKELEKMGYLERKPSQDENGKLLGWDWFIDDYPDSVMQETSKTDDSVMQETRRTEKPKDGKPNTIKNDSIKNESEQEINPAVENFYLFVEYWNTTFDLKRINLERSSEKTKKALQKKFAEQFKDSEFAESWKILIYNISGMPWLISQSWWDVDFFLSHRNKHAYPIWKRIAMGKYDYLKRDYFNEISQKPTSTLEKLKQGK